VEFSETYLECHGILFWWLGVIPVKFRLERVDQSCAWVNFGVQFLYADCREMYSTVWVNFELIFCTYHIENSKWKTSVLISLILLLDICSCLSENWNKLSGPQLFKLTRHLLMAQVNTVKRRCLLYIVCSIVDQTVQPCRHRRHCRRLSSPRCYLTTVTVESRSPRGFITTASSMPATKLAAGN